ncbi:hypothetical protein A2U01_0099702, partial [Trifolium medium]|nr:hypothetical protein [Trifolium medium]
MEGPIPIEGHRLSNSAGIALEVVLPVHGGDKVNSPQLPGSLVSRGVVVGSRTAVQMGNGSQARNHSPISGGRLMD